MEAPTTSPDLHTVVWKETHGEYNKKYERFFYPSKPLLTHENANRSGRNCETAKQKVRKKPIRSSEIMMQMHNQDDNTFNSNRINRGP